MASQALSLKAGLEKSKVPLVSVTSSQPLQKDKRKTCTRINTLVVLLVFSIACNVGLATYGVILWVQHTQSPNPPLLTPDQLRDTESVKSTAVCVLCRSLGLGGGSKALRNTGLHVVKGEVEEEDLCCRENAESLQLLLQLLEILNRTETTNALSDGKRDWGVPNPSAHLFLDKRTNFSAPLAWTDVLGMGVAHTTGNVLSLKSGRLYIPESGMYFVYSALTFKVRQNLSSPMVIDHCLHRKSESAPLLTRKTTLPVSAETFASSFLSGTLRLLEGDQIGVSASNVSFVYDFWSSSYFGLLKIGE